MVGQLLQKTVIDGEWESFERQSSVRTNYRQHKACPFGDP
jgi:hypothetical protein